MRSNKRISLCETVSNIKQIQEIAQNWDRQNH